jgi:hypothetical protein
MKKLLSIVMVAFLVTTPLYVSSCISTGGEQGVETLESMPEADYQRLKLYSTLGVKIAANRLVEEGTVSTEDLEIAADVLDAIKTTPIMGGGQLLVSELLEGSGLTSTEIEALIQIVVFELEARGIFDQLGDGGLINLAPRTEDFVDALIDSLRSAGTVSQEELAEAHAMGISE